MNIQNKKRLINNLKVNLEYLINESLYELPNNITQIKNIYNDHKIFINFVEKINLYEDYKWNKIKQDYNKVKKKINQDKKLYLKIVRIYGVVNNYYLIDEFNNKNKIIQQINEYNYIIMIEWNEIKKLHRILTCKRSSYIKNINIIKVFNMNKEYENLIKRIYEIYNELVKLKTYSNTDFAPDYSNTDFKNYSNTDFTPNYSNTETVLDIGSSP